MRRAITPHDRHLPSNDWVSHISVLCAHSYKIGGVPRLTILIFITGIQYLHIFNWERCPSHEILIYHSVLSSTCPCVVFTHSSSVLTMKETLFKAQKCLFFQNEARAAGELWRSLCNLFRNAVHSGSSCKIHITAVSETCFVLLNVTLVDYLINADIKVEKRRGLFSKQVSARACVRSAPFLGSCHKFIMSERLSFHNSKPYRVEVVQTCSDGRTKPPCYPSHTTIELHFIS